MVLERAEIVLAMRVVLRREAIEVAYAAPDRSLVRLGKEINALREEELARRLGMAARGVVQCTNIGDGVLEFIRKRK